jgi:formate hydrogenlyase subunit 3/multisubunit Na+/H+ antiporter MnhD subunit
MMLLFIVGAPMLAVLLALLSAVFLLWLERRGAREAAAGTPLVPDRITDRLFDMGPVFVLAPLAMMIAIAPRTGTAWPAIVLGLVVALLARTRHDLLHSECAIKLLWVIGVALALSWAGLELLVIGTGTPVESEQWAILQLGLAPRALWSTALPLSLLVGVVLLGGAPFHFWAADLFQGARPWLAPLAVASLQVSGAGWLLKRLEGIEAFPRGAAVTDSLLAWVALIAFLAGAATLNAQRRAERRVGTLASLNGGLVLAALATAHMSAPRSEPLTNFLVAWSAHLVVALAGADILGRLLPVSSPVPGTPPVLLRRHPITAGVGLYAMFSLAGAPGTPGARLWLETARDLFASGRTGLTMALLAAWLVALTTVVRQLHEAFGISPRTLAPPRPVPWQARTAIWLAGAGLGVIALWRWLT